MSWETIVAYAGVVAIAVYPIAVIVLHFLPTGRNPFRSGLSEYAAGNSRSLMVIALLGLGIGTALLDAGLAAGLGAGKRVAVGILFLGLFAAGHIAAAFVPPNAGGVPRTKAGSIHAAISVVSIIALGIATIAITPVFSRVQHWKVVAPLMGWLELAVVVLALLMLILRIKPLQAVFGLAMRLFYGAGLAWIIVLALHFASLRH